MGWEGQVAVEALWTLGAQQLSRHRRQEVLSVSSTCSELRLLVDRHLLLCWKRCDECAPLPPSGEKNRRPRQIRGGGERR